MTKLILLNVGTKLRGYETTTHECKNARFHRLIIILFITNEELTNFSLIMVKILVDN